MADPIPVAIRNFHQVTSWLYRGGQPGAEGIAALKELGVRTVVSLRWGMHTVETERKHIEAQGMQFLSIRLNYWNLPTSQIIEDFLAILDDPSNHPVFVHCLHGADRTGLLIAIYRMSRESWPVEKAYAEMKKHGFHRFRIRNFKWMLWQYSRSQKQTGIGRPD